MRWRPLLFLERVDRASDSDRYRFHRIASGGVAECCDVDDVREIAPRDRERAVSHYERQDRIGRALKSGRNAVTEIAGVHGERARAGESPVCTAAGNKLPAGQCGDAQ